MSVESGLVTLLAPLVSGRCYPAPAPRDVVSPFLTFQRISTSPYQRTTDPACKPLEAVLMQLDCYVEDSAAGGATSLGYDDVVDLAETVRATLFNGAGIYGGVNVVDDEFDEESDLTESGAHGPVWRRSLSFNMIVRS